MKNYQAVTACPLCWPEGWKRTPAHIRESVNRFKTLQSTTVNWSSETQMVASPISFDRARQLLADELGRMNASGIILSTNVPLRVDGQPSAGAAKKRMDDPGVAVYFTWKGKPFVMARDAFTDIAANVRSLTLAIKAMRDLERHGGSSMMERAFGGFSALPPPEGSKPKRPWFEVMKFPVDPGERELLSAAEVKARFDTLAKRLHPDLPGGSHEAMSELNQARIDALEEIGAGADA